jgi:hypothetical protein
MSNSINLGNAGEHLVMAELLARGFHAFRADRANPAFDISVYRGGRHSLLRVKTTSSPNVQWVAKKDGTVFLEMRDEGDFVALVDLQKGVRNAVIYIVPTKVKNDELQRCHDSWHQHPKRNGEPRKLTQHRAFCLTGKEGPTDIGRDYAKKLERYRDAWWQFEGHSDPAVELQSSVS